MVGSCICIYLMIGITWCLFNTDSKLFCSISEKAYQNGSSYWILVAFVVWSVLWPIDLAHSTLSWAEKHWKRRRS